MEIAKLVRDVVARKAQDSLTIDEAAKIARVNRHWFAKFIQGEIHNPTMANLTAMQAFATRPSKPSRQQKAA